MKKEEFPTFLNEQPTIIFGRTGRELLIIACGILLSFKVWGDITVLLPGWPGIALSIALIAVLMIAFFVLALLKVGYRPLEEWVLAWFLFVASPKVYMYRPEEENVEYAVESEETLRKQAQRVIHSDVDDFE